MRGDSDVECRRMSTADRLRGKRKMTGQRKTATTLCQLRGDDWRSIGCETTAIRRDNGEEKMDDGSAAGGVP